MKYLIKPYNLFLFVAIILLTLSFYIENSFELRLNGVSYTMDMDPVVILFSAFIGIWLLYLVVDKYLYSYALTWLHVIGTILVMIMTVYYQLEGKGGQVIKVYEGYERAHIREHSQYVLPYSGVLYLLMLVLQGLFLYNIINGAEKRRSKKS